MQDFEEKNIYSCFAGVTERVVLIVFKPSSLFLNKTRRESVYNIQPIENISSVIRYGILSYNRAAGVAHVSIAMSDVQHRRERVVVPNGGPLHSYASAYFDPRNPMMYKRRDFAKGLCVLAISSQVLDLEGTIVSDGNAASTYTRFYSPEDGIKSLDFVKVYSEWWTDEDPYEEMVRKRMKCAEILVPDAIPYGYIIGAIVVSEDTQRALASWGFQKEIVIKPNVFFRKEG